MLHISNLSVGFRRSDDVRGNRHLEAIRSLHLRLAAGEIMAVIGESGSGKSLLAQALLGILPENATTDGDISFRGHTLQREDLHRLRGRDIALIPQSVAYLNPLRPVGRQVERAAFLAGLREHEARQARETAFVRYGLAPRVSRQYPHQISGGMARRVLTATATSGQAELIVADEPTTGLDQITIRESLGHLRELADNGKAVLLITHDIAAALEVADRVMVLLHGTTVEIASADDFLYDRLRHPYTRTLWRALPQNDFMDIDDRVPAVCAATGHVPQTGCVHAPRCSLATQPCTESRPKLRELHNGLVRCHHA